MKRFFTLILALLAVSQLSAQTWVSTTAQNKNVVLEEFTGIHCGFCPDGHSRANDLDDQYPDRVVLINIHSGTYATPSTGEPDFRTDAGDDIDDAAGVTGYPSGSVNRMNSPWGQSRTTWATDAATVMAESSPVNIAIQTSVDIATRELTVEVELYYTANSDESTNYLTVALLQNNVPGPQSDYGDYNPDGWVNGKYIHKHIFRQMITSGSWGELISTTTTGDYVYKKYTTVLPADIEGVDLDLQNLEVAAFVHETQANILTGVSEEVSIDAQNQTDLGLADLTSAPADYCTTTLNPIVQVTNNSDNDVTAFDVEAVVDGTSYSKSFSGTLTKGQSTTVDFGSVTVSSAGSYEVELTGFENIKNGSTDLFDMDVTNDYATFEGSRLEPDAFTSLDEGFESSTSIPNNFIVDAYNSSAIKVRSADDDLGAKNTAQALLFYIYSSWDIAGQDQSIVFGGADLSGLTDPFLVFHYAYTDGSLGGTAPTIKLSVSTDCGVNWDVLKSFVAVETGQPADVNYLYSPASSDYVWIGTSLSNYANENVLMKITVVPGTSGNSLYIDEISLDNATSLPEDVLNDFDLTISPNPVNSNATIEYGISHNAPVSFTVLNALGQKVMTQEAGTQAQGVHSNTMDFSSLSTGMYFLEVKAGDQISTQKFIKN